MKVSVLKQMIAGLDDDIDIWFKFKTSSISEYDLEPKLGITFETYRPTKDGPEVICNAIIELEEA